MFIWQSELFLSGFCIMLGMDQHVKNLCYGAAALFLDDTRRALEDFRVPAGFAEAVEAVILCDGVVATTGMGKAGHVARKVASSLCSLGFPSSYIHPGDASHGDVGVIRPGDVLMAFSTSGKTREVIETIQIARKLDVGKVIAVTSHVDGEVRAISDIVLDMGSVKEAGHLHIAPTTSILVMLVIADMVALTAAYLRSVTLEDYGLRHHGGYLGKKCRGEV